MTETEVRIREFCYPEDYAPVYELWEHAGPGIHLRRSDEPDEIEKKLERDPDLFLVAEIGDHLVGSVIGGYDGHDVSSGSSSGITQPRYRSKTHR